MPVRLLKPTLRTSERWHRSSYFDRCLYISLLNLVDDYGRYDANRQLLASECFPYGDEDGLPMTAQTIDGGLRALASKDLIFIYEHDGKQYIQIQRWKERIRQERSKFPEFVGCKVVLGNDCQLPVKCTASVRQSLASPPTPTPTPEERETADAPQIPPMTRKDFDALCQMRNVPPECGEWFWNTHDGRNWVDATGQLITKVEPLLLNSKKNWQTKQYQQKIQNRRYSEPELTTDQKAEQLLRKML